MLTSVILLSRAGHPDSRLAASIAQTMKASDIHEGVRYGFAQDTQALETQLP